MIKTNIGKIILTIKEAALRAGRGFEDICLICVTKEAKSGEMLEAISGGAANLGENRVKEAILKHKAIGDRVRWHLIGHLQTNKVKDAVKIFDLIHSVDSDKLARAIDKEAEKADKIQDVLVEVNISGEESKFGINPDNLHEFLNTVRKLPNIHVTGLMTVTPFTEKPETSRPYFRRLKELADRSGLTELSMGMTQDYEVAVEEGATMVRVGRAIFQQ